MFSIVVEGLNAKESLKIIHNIYRVTAQLLSINNDYLGRGEVVQPAFYVSCVHPRHQTPAGYITPLEQIHEGRKLPIIIKIAALQTMAHSNL